MYSAPDQAAQAADAAPTRSLLTGRRGLVVLLCVVALLYAAGVNSYWRFQRDSALQMGLARSLAEEGTYRFNGKTHAFVLPGFPALLSLVYMTAGESFLAMNVLVSLLGFGCAALGWALLRELPLTGRQAAACAVLLAFSRTLYYYSSHVMADVPFTFLALVTLICGAQMLRRRGRACWLWCGGAAASACAASLVRPLGPALLAALVLAIWLRPGARAEWRRRAGQTLLVLVPLAVAGMAWGVRCALQGASGEQMYYGKFVGRYGLGLLIERMMRHALDLPKALADCVLGVGAGTAVGVVLAAVMLVGLVAALRRGERLVSIYGLVCLAGVCIASPGRRYLLPVLPVMLYWLTLGLHAGGQWLRARTAWWTPRRLRTTGWVLFALLLAVNVMRIGKVIREARARDFYQVVEDGRLVDYFALADWLREHAGPRDVVVTREAEVVHYLSRVRTRRVPTTWTHSKYWQRGRGRKFLTRVGATLLVRDHGKDERTARLAKVARAHPGAFERVYSVGKLEVFRVHPDKL